MGVVRWFQGGNTKIYEDAKSYGTDPGGNNRGIGLELPGDEYGGFLFWGDDGWIKYYLIRRYQDQVRVERVYTYFNDGWFTSGHLNGFEPMIITPGLAMMVVNDGNNNTRYVQLFEYGINGCTFGPARDVAQDIDDANLTNLPAVDHVGAGPYNGNRIVAMGVSKAGAWNTSPPRASRHGFVSYSWDAGLNLSIDVGPYLAYDYDLTTRPLAPDFIYQVGSKLYAFGRTYANTDSASQIGRACWEYDFDGVTAYFNRVATWSISTGSGLGTTNPTWLTHDRCTFPGLTNDVLMYGAGQGAISYGSDLNRYYEDPPDTWGSEGVQSGTDPDGNLVSASYGSRMWQRVSGLDAFDITGGIVGGSGTGAVDSWTVGNPGFEVTYTITASPAVVTMFDHDPTESPIDMVAVDQFQVDDHEFTHGAFFASSSASSGPIRLNGHVMCKFSDTITVVALSNHAWSDRTGSVPDEFNKNYRVFALFYKQGLIIPELMIPRKRWAYPHEPDMRKHFDRADVPDDVKTEWMDMMTEWSNKRGITDEENYISMEEWVHLLRVENGDV